jgi:hypothetical protein
MVAMMVMHLVEMHLVVMHLVVMHLVVIHLVEILLILLILLIEAQIKVKVRRELSHLNLYLKSQIQEILTISVMKLI